VVRTLPAIVAAIGVLLSPVLSVVSGMLILDDPVGWREIGALLSVCAAMALVLIQPSAKSSNQ
jgi:drug/metabolite transporter (DMT)-like permease